MNINRSRVSPQTVSKLASLISLPKGPHAKAACGAVDMFQYWGRMVMSGTPIERVPEPHQSQLRSQSTASRAASAAAKSSAVAKPGSRRGHLVERPVDFNKISHAEARAIGDQVNAHRAMQPQIEAEHAERAAEENRRSSARSHRDAHNRLIASVRRLYGAKTDTDQHAPASEREKERMTPGQRLVAAAQRDYGTKADPADHSRITRHVGMNVDDHVTPAGRRLVEAAKARR